MCAPGFPGLEDLLSVNQFLSVPKGSFLAVQFFLSHDITEGLLYFSLRSTSHLFLLWLWCHCFFLPHSRCLFLQYTILLSQLFDCQLIVLLGFECIFHSCLKVLLFLKELLFVQNELLNFSFKRHILLLHLFVTLLCDGMKLFV